MTEFRRLLLAMVGLLSGAVAAESGPDSGPVGGQPGHEPSVDGCPSTPTFKYSHVSDRVIPGPDVTHTGTYTLAEAEEWCRISSTCKAFSAPTKAVMRSSDPTQRCATTGNATTTKCFPADGPADPLVSVTFSTRDTLEPSGHGRAMTSCVKKNSQWEATCMVIHTVEGPLHGKRVTEVRQALSALTARSLRTSSVTELRPATALPVFRSPTGASVMATQTHVDYVCRHAIKAATQKPVDRFLGIPYAEPPIGDRRFRPPIVHSPWGPSVLDATKFPEECAQLSLVPTVRFEGSENCLFLNVYRPAGAAEGADLPVLFYIHGGGDIIGAADKTFPGDYLAAEHGMVVVVVQYRLDVFGFLALGTLAAEQVDGTTGNYALQDQRAGLEWVQRNIATFGGDKRRVTLSGQSAGATSVCAHMVSPASKGLFSRAIGVSPLCLGALLFAPLTQAVNFGRAYAEHVGCSSDDTAATVACLRALPTETLAPPVALTGLVSPNKSIPLPLLLPFLPWGAVVDGALRGVPMRPLQAVAAKTFADVPFLIGSVRDEGSIFIPIIPAITGVVKIGPGPLGFRLVTRHFYEENATEAIVKVYREVNVPDEPSRVIVLGNDTGTQRHGLRENFRGLYHFNFSGTSEMDKTFGVYHASDVPYLFRVVGPTWEHRDFTLSFAMQCYYAAFARSGNPNIDGPAASPRCAEIERPSWPAYLATTDETLTFGEPLAVDTNYRKGRCDHWDVWGYDTTIRAT